MIVWFLPLLLVAMVGLRLGFQIAARSIALRCIICDGPLRRIRRLPIDRVISVALPVHRYRCVDPSCCWEGLFVQPLGQRLRVDPHPAVSMVHSFSLATATPLHPAWEDHPKPSIETYYRQGMLHLRQGNYQQAVEQFTYALEIDPQQARIYYNRGSICSQLGQTQNAIADFTQAIRLDPTLAKAYYNRAGIRYQMGDLAGALKDYLKAAKFFNEKGDHASFEKAREAIATIQPPQPRGETIPLE
jgi:hypothetical protein